jgi:hypothetical protein
MSRGAAAGVEDLNNDGDGDFETKIDFLRSLPNAPLLKSAAAADGETGRGRREMPRCDGFDVLALEEATGAATLLGRALSTLGTESTEG